MTREYKSVFYEETVIHLALRKEELSKEAFRHYKRTVILFDEYLCRINHTEKGIGESVIEEWISEISKNISVNTASQHVHYIRQLLLYLIDCGYPCFIPKTVATKDTYVPYLYTDDDIENIFKAADSLVTSRNVKNVYIENEMPLLLRLLFCCGLRVSEALNIKVGDIDFERNLMILRVTKKYKQRLVPFEENLAEIIYLYCVAMGILNDSEACLFPETDKYIPVSANTVGNYYRVIRKKAGIHNNKRERLCKPSTRNQRLSALSAFSEYAQNRDFDAASVFRSAITKIPAKKSNQKLRAVFTREEIKILLSLPDENYETGLRDKVLLSFMYATGARAQETCDLRVCDLRIDIKSSSVTLTVKGLKIRQVGISRNLAETVHNYIRHRHIEKHPEKHIFSSQTHEKMTISCIEGIYKKYVVMAKSENTSLFLADSYPPHSMRHSTACHLLEAGVDIVTIKNILGHVSVQTVERHAPIAVNDDLIRYDFS